MNKPLSTEIIATDGRERLVFDGAELIVKAGPDKGATLTLGPGPLRIGSAPDCHLVLHDRTVSAYHAEVSSQDQGYLLTDTGSLNRIRLGPWIVERVSLAAGMRLQLGGTHLLVRPTGERHALDLHQGGALAGVELRSVAMRAVYAELERYAHTDIPVLIEGETGTGKELAARTIHDLSGRRGGPFVVADLSCISPSLIASELFGHERGAFTGADRARAGLLEEADRGTLFLDEVGELPLDLQPMLLRALEQKASRRVGGRTTTAHDLRLVAATHRNLAEEVRAGRFRQDLYFRLAVGRLRMPPLRARREDIPVLAQHFAQQDGTVLSPELVQVLVSHDWPGNVRELRNVIARVGAMGDLGDLEPAAAPPAPGQLIPPLHHARRQAVWEFERQYIEDALRLSGDNVAEAARLAQVSESFMHRLVRRHGRRSHKERS